MWFASPAGMAPTHFHAGWVLEADHEVMDSLFFSVIAAARQGDQRGVVAAWSVFERHLLQHLDVEEMLVLPLAALERPGDVQWLRAEHGEIRAIVGDLGIAVELQRAQVADLEELAARLRAHARREHEWLYRWAEYGLDATRTAHIGRRLRAAWKKAGHVVRHAQERRP